MQEHVTKAFILSSDPVGEADLRIHFFTETQGRLAALAKSARKPTAKLTAHLQPFSLVQVRLVERRGVHVADALSIRRAPDDPNLLRQFVGIAKLIASLTDLHHPDPELWQLIEQGSVASPAMLRVLGFDPAHARCFSCGKTHPEHFTLDHAAYLCAACLRRMADRDRQVVVS